MILRVRKAIEDWLANFLPTGHWTFFPMSGLMLSTFKWPKFGQFFKAERGRPKGPGERSVLILFSKKERKSSGLNNEFTMLFLDTYIFSELSALEHELSLLNMKYVKFYSRSNFTRKNFVPLMTLFYCFSPTERKLAKIDNIIAVTTKKNSAKLGIFHDGKNYVPSFR